MLIRSRAAPASRGRAASIALWCALLAAMLGRYAWPFDLFAHFRVQYTLLFLIVAILLFALRAPLLGASWRSPAPSLARFLSSATWACRPREPRPARRSSESSRSTSGFATTTTRPSGAFSSRRRPTSSCSRSAIGTTARSGSPLSCRPIRIRSTRSCAARRDRVLALADRLGGIAARWRKVPACVPRASRSIGKARQ